MDLSPSVAIATSPRWRSIVPRARPEAANRRVNQRGRRRELGGGVSGGRRRQLDLRRAPCRRPGAEFAKDPGSRYLQITPSFGSRSIVAIQIRRFSVNKWIAINSLGLYVNIRSKYSRKAPWFRLALSLLRLSRSPAVATAAVVARARHVPFHPNLAQFLAETRGVESGT